LQGIEAPSAASALSCVGLVVLLPVRAANADQQIRIAVIRLTRTRCLLHIRVVVFIFRTPFFFWLFVLGEPRFTRNEAGPTTF